jgi:hypothetical protein
VTFTLELPMRSLLAALALILTTGFAQGEGLNVLHLLKRDLGNSIEVVSSREIRYCPDNTCEIVKAKRQVKLLPEFLYLSLFHESGYVELGKSFDGRKPFREAAIEESEVRKKVAMFCPDTDKSPRCILDNMRSRMGIQSCIGRYDEGQFCVSCGEQTKCRKL